MMWDYRRGYLAALVGTVAGVSCGTYGTVAAISPIVADDPNGWWHDAHGWLVFLVPVAFLVGGVAGCWLGLRTRGHRRQGSTAWITGALLIGTAFVAWLTPGPNWVKVTASVAWIVASPLFARDIMIRDVMIRDIMIQDESAASTHI